MRKKEKEKKKNEKVPVKSVWKVQQQKSTIAWEIQTWLYKWQLSLGLWTYPLALLIQNFNWRFHP